MSRRNGRRTFYATIAVLAVVVALTGWWFGFGRYTTTPKFIGQTQAQAVAAARKAGFEIRYGSPLFEEKIPKNTVVSQQPAATERIRRGGVIMLTLSRGPERYTVPSDVGKPFDVVQSDLNELKMVVRRVDTYSDAYPADYVVSLNPKPGSVQPPNTTITVTVSKGKAPITVPKVVGMDFNTANQTLTNLGLTVAQTQKQSDQPAGQVIAQSIPARLGRGHRRVNHSDRQHRTAAGAGAERVRPRLLLRPGRADPAAVWPPGGQGGRLPRRAGAPTEPAAGHDGHPGHAGTAVGHALTEIPVPRDSDMPGRAARTRSGTTAPDGATNASWRIGAHVPAAGGLARASLPYIEATGANVVQVYVSNPRGWALSPGDPAQDEAFTAGCAERDVLTFIHASLLVNLGSPTEETVRRSAVTLDHALRRGAAIGARAVVFHAGNVVDAEHAPTAYRQLHDTLLPLLDAAMATGGPRLLVEPSAGGGR